MSVRVTHLVPDTRITHTKLKTARASSEEAPTRITQTVFLTRIRVAEPRVPSSSSGVATRERRTIIVSTTDRDCKVSESGCVYTNRGATDDVTFALPPSSQLRGGEVYRYRAAEAGYYLRVVADGSDVIVNDGIEATFVRCSARHGTLELEYQGSGEWFVTYEPIGLWLYDE